MDQWIWTDAEVADVLRTEYAGVKLNFDNEKVRKHVVAYEVSAFPSMLIIEPATGTVI